MTISDIAFKYRKLLFLILGLLLLNGVQAYFTLPAQEDPSIRIREAIIITQHPGMSPERVEQLISKKLEQEIRKIPEITQIRSTSSTGQSIIHVKIYDHIDELKPIWQNLRNKMQAIYSTLPKGTALPVVNDEFGDVSVITLALTADGFDFSEMHDTAKYLRDLLFAEKGTKKIELLGVQEQRVFLEISNAFMAQLGITPNELMQALQTQNIVRPGGEVDTGRRSYIVEPTGNFESITDINNTLISIPGVDRVLPLKDIVTLKKGYIDPPFQPAYFQGEPAVVLAISMLEGYNVLEYAPRIKARVSEIEQTLPLGYKINYATYQAEQVKNTVQGVSINVLQTLIIVLIVVIVFLGLRVGLIVGAIVPCVMLITLSIMQFTGLTLERMSLATLIIALGLLVDNGIVVAEDFKRRLEKGESRKDTLKHCGQQLMLPLLISSLTTILVFLPLMLAQHPAGEYTRSISLVILISLMTSWVLALCITPTLCYFFIKTPSQHTLENNTSFKINNKKTGNLSRIIHLYRQFIEWALSHRGLFLGCIALFVCVGVGLTTFVGSQFFPDSDRAQILVSVQMPADTSARETDQTMREIFSWLNQDNNIPNIENFSGYSGFGGPRFVLSLAPEDPSNNKGFIVINITDTKAVEPTLKHLREAFSERFPDVFVRVNKMFLGPSDSSSISIQVKGTDIDTLYQHTQKIMQVLHNTDDVIDIRQNWENRIGKIKVLVDQQRARRAGITSNDIATALQSYFNGIQVTEYRQDDNIIPILLRGEDNERNNLDRLRTLNIYSSETGLPVPLFQIADFAPEHQFARIHRENLFRTMTVEARHKHLTGEELKHLIDQDIQQINDALPEGHWIEYDGVIRESIEAQNALSANMPIVLGFIILLLVAQFNSFRKPLIIAITIPLAFVSAIFGLFFMNAPFGFMVTLGLYSLAGIIVNNAIVLIDRFDIEINAGKTPYQAIIDACLARLRPITMTTITTIAGLMPLIISKEPLFYGMASVIAFGLGIGTLLTLGVVPVLYAILFKVPVDKDNNKLVAPS